MVRWLNGPGVLVVLVQVVMNDVARAAAQAYPNHPIRLVVPRVAVTTICNLYARLIGNKIAQSSGQRVVVDNRPGAFGGLIGREARKSARVLKAAGIAASE